MEDAIRGDPATVAQFLLRVLVIDAVVQRPLPPQRMQARGEDCDGPAQHARAAERAGA